jgi:hypothetical protein
VGEHLRDAQRRDRHTLPLDQTASHVGVDRGLRRDVGEHVDARVERHLVRGEVAGMGDDLAARGVRGRDDRRDHLGLRTAPAGCLGHDLDEVRAVGDALRDAGGHVRGVGDDRAVGHAEV